MAQSLASRVLAFIRRNGTLLQEDTAAKIYAAKINPAKQFTVEMHPNNGDPVLVRVRADIAPNRSAHIEDKHVRRLTPIFGGDTLVTSITFTTDGDMHGFTYLGNQEMEQTDFSLSQENDHPAIQAMSARVQVALAL